MLADFVSWLQLGLPAYLFVITVVVFFHELGHFLVARACGVAVDTFSIGFGPAIFGWTDRHGTRWKVSWIPFGGYVKFAGDQSAASTPDRQRIDAMSAAERAKLFHEKSLWRRAAVVTAGPFANFVLAVVIFATIFLAVGQEILRPVIGSVAPQSAGAAAGLKAGDRIASVDGEQVQSYGDFDTRVAMNAGHTLTLTVIRDGRTLVLSATPRRERVRNPLGGIQEAGSLGTAVRYRAVVGQVVPHSAANAAGLQTGDIVESIDGQPIASFSDLLGVIWKSAGKHLQMTISRHGQRVTLAVTPRTRVAHDTAGKAVTVGFLGVGNGNDMQAIRTLRYGPIGALREALHEVWFVIDNTLTYMGRMLTGQQGVSELRGPVGIAGVSEEVAAVGLLPLIKLAAFISVSIGLVNLFPVPILDGGHLLYYGCEAVLGRPLGARVQDIGFRVGLALMVGLMVLATWNDLVRLNLF